MNNRETKAQKIIQKENQIKQIDNHTFQVKSQSLDKWYDVVSTESGFICSCPDSKFRKTTCKHSISVEISQGVRKQIEQAKQKQVIINPVEINGCKFCESDNIIKKGLRKNKNYSIQTFQCKGMQIHHNFIRSHMRIDGDTPSKRAGITVNGLNKWITIIQNAQVSKVDKRKLQDQDSVT